MTRGERIRRRVVMAFWRLANPLARRLAGIVPFWVVLETTGRRSGRVRRTPLARGPVDGRTAWVIAVYGRHSSFVRNLEADPRVRFKSGRRWYDGTASVEPMREDVVGRFSRYARMGPARLGSDPCLVRIALDE